MAMAVSSHLLSPRSTVSFARFTPPLRALSRTSSLFRSQPNLRPNLRLHVVCTSIRKLSEVEPIPIAEDPEQQLDGRIPVGAGVYGVYDSNGQLHFIGISRCISNSIKKHRRLVPGMCCSVKVGSTGKGKPESNALRDAFYAWMEEYLSSTGLIPPGNESKSHVWAPPPMSLHLESEQLDFTESLDQLLKEQHMVAFIHGPPQETKKEHDMEYHASTRVLGLLVSHGFDFVTVDLVEECHSGLQECLLDHFGYATCPQVFVGGKFVGGEEVIWNLAEKGKLHTIAEV